MKLIIRDNSKKIYESAIEKKAETPWVPQTLADLMAKFPGCNFQVLYKQAVLDGVQTDTVEVYNAEGNRIATDVVISDPLNCKLAEDANRIISTESSDLGLTSGDQLPTSPTTPEGLESPMVNPYSAKVKVKLNMHFAVNGSLTIRAERIQLDWNPLHPFKKDKEDSFGDKDNARMDTRKSEKVRRELSEIVSKALDTIKVGNYSLRDLVRKYTMVGLLNNEDYRLKQATFELRKELKKALEGMDSEEVQAFKKVFGSEDNSINYADLLTDGTLSYKAGKKFNLNLPKKANKVKPEKCNCGEYMDLDPKSGEYYCPECDGSPKGKKKIEKKKSSTTHTASEYQCEKITDPQRFLDLCGGTKWLKEGDLKWASIYIKKYGFAYVVSSLGKPVAVGYVENGTPILFDEMDVRIPQDDPMYLCLC